MRAGWALALGGRRLSRLEETAALGAPAKSLCLACDVTDPEQVAAPRPHSAPYTATKHAITGLTKSTSLDGRTYDIACGQIDVGNAATELLRPMAQSETKDQAGAEPMIDVALVGAAIIQMANLPLDANIQFMTLMATKMPLIGRG